MNDRKHTSRRAFLRNSSLGLGAGIAGITVPSVANAAGHYKKTAREINVACFDLHWLQPDETRESRIERVLERMESVAGMKPDIICLPEFFDITGVGKQKTINEIAEDEINPGPVTTRIASFAKNNNCYIVCPLITRKNGKFYNSSILLDRKGNIAAVYHKTHPHKNEMLANESFRGGSVIPGGIDQPVIETDFGKLGIQMGGDVHWTEGWSRLKQKGADIVLFPSQFAGGRMLNYYAQKNNYYIVAASRDGARIIDKSGTEIETTSDFLRFVWATVNLEKINVPSWPTNELIPKLYKKYGDRISVRLLITSDIVTIESHDPRLNVSDILKEFDIPTNDSLLSSEMEIQEKYRQANKK